MRGTSADTKVDITMTFTDNKITKCVFTAWDQTLAWNIVKSVSIVFWCSQDEHDGYV